MLTIKNIKENKDDIIALLKVKNFEAANLINEIIILDDKRKTIQNENDNALSELNAISKEIGILFKNGKIEEANKLKIKTSEIKENSKSLGSELPEIENQINSLLIQIPNVPHISVPRGKGAEDNVSIKSGGEVVIADNKRLAHWDLAKKYDIIDFETGNKITGSGFPVYKDKGAKLQRALINFFLDEAVSEGYKEIMPPILINESSAFATGQLPDKEGQMYYMNADNYYLAPTAEVPLTNIYRDTILNYKVLPVKITAYTPCFRREAGSYGKDVRGLNRLHQFDKVEIVCIEHPENSYKTLENMVLHVENLLVKLMLPYRILKLCGGDLSFTSALTYDFEVYSAGQEKWLEVSSVSNFESFQSNRLKLRFKNETDKTALAHTLNGSALALPRIVAALLENNQTPEGIVIPECLVKYTGFELIS
jgi:seryl-tRNA synthetase